MNRFGICCMPPENRQHEYTTGRQWSTRPADMGDSNPPPVLYFRTAEERDNGLIEMVKKFPSVMFGTFEVVSCSVTAVGPITNYSLSEKGLLPV
jgi:hypothetical protein